ncbi:MerR family transcriptional regulator [Sinobaca qinghaiensis]|uniref:MerR family transcriptional regulator n=1 Tax=Sinobaca qinghaiensis TaxID=342944 RepID=A0A419UWK2_9BACL|nr:MerR family transcriptional regulator [Sinobaca qinghaiensis]RKD69505.1 MerR family transcriptional regulator [Sinobaca qinghaiensis]
MLQIKEAAEAAGISVRTLHHYDDIGLLVPSIRTESGYRLYNDDEMDRLQQILLLRDAGVPLATIKTMPALTTEEQVSMLAGHKERLRARQQQIEEMIRTIDRTIRHHKGEKTMNNPDKFKGFDFSTNPYEKEAQKRWGREKVNAVNRNVNQWSENEQERFNDIYRSLAEVRREDPGSDEVQQRIGHWYDLLQTIGEYPPEVFISLGRMYTEDERFTKNIDQFGDGLAVFMQEAMRIYGNARLSS